MSEWTEWHERHKDKIELVAGIDCWIWTGCAHPNGHGRVSSRSGHNYAHRAAYEAFHNKHPGELYVRHMCGCAACVRPGHLKLGTAADNAKDTSDMQRTNTNLTHEDVRGLRRDYDKGMPLSDIAEKYNIAFGSVYPIVCYNNFRHVDPEGAGQHNIRIPRKLTQELADEIRQRLERGEGPQSMIAAEYGVAQSVISRINTGVRWPAK